MALRGIDVDGTVHRIDYQYIENRPSIPDAERCTVTLSSVTLGTAWTGDGPYSQQVTLQGVTADSKVDLQPDSAVLAQMMDDGTTALWVENDQGTLTAKAMGAAPTAGMTVQCTITEVLA